MTSPATAEAFGHILTKRDKTMTKMIAFLGLIVMALSLHAGALQLGCGPVQTLYNSDGSVTVTAQCIAYPDQYYTSSGSWSGSVVLGSQMVQSLLVSYYTIPIAAGDTIPFNMNTQANVRLCNSDCSEATPSFAYAFAGAWNDSAPLQSVGAYFHPGTQVQLSLNTTISDYQDTCVNHGWQYCPLTLEATLY